MSKLERLSESGDGVILVDTKAVNRLIDKLNAIIDTQVSPQGVGKYMVSDKNAILDLSGIEQYIYGLVQAANNGGGGGGASGGGGSGGGSGGVPPGGGGGSSEFESWKNNVQWTAKCNGDGTLTISGG